MNQSNERRLLLIRADRLGIIASMLCFIHCVLTPIVVSLGAVGAHYLPAQENVHRILAVFIAAIGTVAMLFGYFRHRRSRVPVLMSSGLLLIFAGAYSGNRLPSHLAEVAITMIGSCFMMGGHFLNHTFCKKCERCNQPCSAAKTTGSKRPI